MTNCPNCGAPKTGSKCPYCDTTFTDIAAMAIGKKVRMSFEADGVTYEFDMVTESATLDCRSNPTSYYADGMRVFTSCSPEYGFSFGGYVVPDEDGKMVKVSRV